MGARCLPGLVASRSHSTLRAGELRAGSTHGLFLSMGVTLRGLQRDVKETNFKGGKVLHSPAVQFSCVFLFLKMHTSHVCMKLQPQAPYLGIRGASGCAHLHAHTAGCCPASQPARDVFLVTALEGSGGHTWPPAVETRDAAQHPQGPGHRRPREGSTGRSPAPEGSCRHAVRAGPRACKMCVTAAPSQPALRTEGCLCAAPCSAPSPAPSGGPLSFDKFWIRLCSLLQSHSQKRSCWCTCPASGFSLLPAVSTHWSLQACDTCLPCSHFPPHPRLQQRLVLKQRSSSLSVSHADSRAPPTHGRHSLCPGFISAGFTVSALHPVPGPRAATQQRPHLACRITPAAFQRLLSLCVHRSPTGSATKEFGIKRT